MKLNTELTWIKKKKYKKTPEEIDIVMWIQEDKKMKLTNKEWLEIYELNKKFNKEKRLYKLDDYINNLSGQKER